MVAGRDDRPLRILFTNNTLAGRAGSELFVLDLAKALMRRGHNPVAYSMRLGEVADELRTATIPVVDDLADLTQPPDLIHGQHHLDAMAAMQHFPGVPAVFVCHGWAPWQERPPRYPGISRYVAVDDLCYERLISDQIDPARCRTHYNFVDLDLFNRRAPLPERPTRVAVLSNYLSESHPTVQAIQTACAQMGLPPADVIGTTAGTATAEVGQVLAGYDIVFAKARAALEALAVGCAVVVADFSGVGGMVTSDNVERLRRFNFGVRTMQAAPATAQSVRSCLERYDPQDASRVCDHIRSVCGLEAATDLWLDLYHEVLQEAEGQPGCAPTDTQLLRASSAYLRELASLVHGAERAQLSADASRAQHALASSQIADLDAALLATSARLAQVETTLDGVLQSKGWRALTLFRDARDRTLRRSGRR